MKLLALPLWCLATALGGVTMFLAASFDGADQQRGFYWVVGWIVAELVPMALLCHALDKERRKRVEVEKRWRKEVADATKYV